MFGALDLLRKLGSGVRPDGTQRTHKPAFERRSFEQVLDDAHMHDPWRRGVRIAASVRIDFDRRDYELMSDATDEAERSGARSLLVAWQERAVRIDVESRTVVEAQEELAGRIVPGVDAVVFAPDAHGSLRSGLTDAGSDAVWPRGMRVFPPLKLAGAG